MEVSIIQETIFTRTTFVLRQDEPRVFIRCRGEPAADRARQPLGPRTCRRGHLEVETSPRFRDVRLLSLSLSLFLFLSPLRLLSNNFSSTTSGVRLAFSENPPKNPGSRPRLAERAARGRRSGALRNQDTPAARS